MHSPEKMSELASKKIEMRKVFKLLKTIEINQLKNHTYAVLVNPTYENKVIAQNFSKTIEPFYLKSIDSFFHKLAEDSPSLDQFSDYAKQYESMRFVHPSYVQNYVNTKKKYVLESFYKELKQIIDDNKTMSCGNAHELSNF